MVDDAGWKTIAEELQKRGINLTNLLQNTHAGTALILSSLMEDAFKMAFEAAMGHMSKEALKKLLVGYGPLSSLSAKTEVAYGMHFITREMRSDANLIRGIRNKFAHSTSQLHFDSDEIVQIGKNLSTFDKEQDVLQAYMKAIDVISKGLVERIKLHLTAAALAGQTKNAS